MRIWMKGEAVTKDRNAVREILVYLVCGVVSTLISWGCMFGVNYVFFGGTAYPTPGQNIILSLANWTSGMSSAYIMNRKLVFRSKEPIGPEFGKFTVSRLSTLAFDQGARQVLGYIGLDVYVTTFLVSCAVTVLNYIISKVAVFRRDGQKS